ncbi:6-phosphogluconolactonase [[Eubacterium] cellulosolvens]
MIENRDNKFIFPNLNITSKVMAKEISDLINSVISKKGRFTLALSGGNTPRTLYGLLASEFSNKIPWKHVHLFWGDERYVPKNHAQSNFAMAYDSFISRVNIPQENVHRIPVEHVLPEKSAEFYEMLLKKMFGYSTEQSDYQSFDLILLGMGEDGHTASLFPANPVLFEKHRLVCAVNAPLEMKPIHRITITFPIIDKANYVFFLISGAKKEKILKLIFKKPKKAKKIYPAAMVNPIGKTVWFIDSNGMSDIKTM